MPRSYISAAVTLRKHSACVAIQQVQEQVYCTPAAVRTGIPASKAWGVAMLGTRAWPACCKPTQFMNAVAQVYVAVHVQHYVSNL
jgi:hypothetical protein